MSDKGLVKVEGIRCENPDCDYENTSVKPNEYKNWINEQCPECGEILLTENDYNIYKFLTATTEIANKISPDDVQLPTDTAKVYKPTSKNTQ